jgi:hypothetical protein
MQALKQLPEASLAHRNLSGVAKLILHFKKNSALGRGFPL